MNGSMSTYCAERRHALRDGNQFGDQRLEAQEVGQSEGGGAEEQRRR